MSVGKKIFILLVLLVLLLIYSVYSFDYKTIISQDENLTQKVSSAKSKIETYTKELMGTKESVSQAIPSKIELVKENDLIVMNGQFQDENHSKLLMEKLSVNKLGDVSYNKNATIPSELVSKISSLITPLKDFFNNNTKISILGNNLEVNGELKDKDYKDLFESIVNRTGFNTKFNITEATPSKTQEMINVIKDNNLNNSQLVASNKEVNSIVKEKDEDASNISSKSKQIQSDINKILQMKKINFELRSTKVTKDSYSVIEEIAKILKDNPNIKIEIAGHTDSRGAADLNKKISQNRANSVKNIVVSLGIDASRLTSVGYGEDSPIAQNDANGESEANRRVEFNIVGE